MSESCIHNTTRLILRIKRRRDEDCQDVIHLNVNNTNNDDKSSLSSGKKITLKRKRTLGYLDKHDLDTQTLQLHRDNTTSTALVDENNKPREKRTRKDVIEDDSRSISESSNNRPAKRIYYLPKSRRTLKEANNISNDGVEAHLTTTPPNTNNDMIVVDMQQVVLNKNDHSIGKNNTKNSNNNNSNSICNSDSNSNIKKVKILKPPDRLLEKGLKTAYTKNDFNDIAAAIVQGCDVNHQYIPNIQMQMQKKTETNNSESVTLVGCSALMVASLHGNIRMVRRLLLCGADSTLTNASGMQAIDLIGKGSKFPLAASVKLEISSLLVTDTQKRSLFEKNEINIEEQIGEGQDYVVDIFTIENTDISESEESSEIPQISVEGLVVDETGNLDLVLAYDSDWSDLGDDEDPDSNDERYEGNDYPEEEDNDDNNDNDYLVDINEYKNPMENDNGEGDDLEHYNSDYDLNNDDDYEDSLPKMYSDRHIGRVLRPHMRDITEDISDNLRSMAFHNSSDIRQLWGENEEEKNTRIMDMRDKTGMRFASNPREFDSRSGLAKYGGDLSDDEQYYGYDQYGEENTDKRFSNYNDIAYDSEIDMSE